MLCDVVPGLEGDFLVVFSLGNQMDPEARMALTTLLPHPSQVQRRIKYDKDRLRHLNTSFRQELWYCPVPVIDMITCISCFSTNFELFSIFKF
jgi:hypothetical protein